MKITFEGPTVTDVVQQAHFFSLAFKGETPEQVLTLQPRINLGSVPLAKKSPGRPPNPESKKGKAAAAKVVEESQETAQVNNLRSPFEMVGVTGFEPATPQTAPHKTITKDDLTKAFQKILEKERSASGAEVSGLMKIKEIFSQFGVARLGELDEKRYHEMYAVVEKAL